MVSIIVPSYNQGRFIRATLDSILSQDYRPLEVLVVDGASTDDTTQILHDYAARYLELRWWSEPDKGPHEAVNKGFERARGVYAGIQSSDDIYLPGAVKAGVDALESHPETDIVYADGYGIDEQGGQLFSPTNWASFSLANFLCGRTFILQSSAFFRLDAARRVGGWRDKYFVADVDLWLRMIFKRPAVKLDGVWSAWRIHDQQRNTQTRKIWESHGRMLKESEDIRKAPWHLRLAAEAGRRMLTQHYNPTGSRWFVLYQLWRAILTYPPSALAVVNKTRLVPGLGRLLAWFGRVRGSGG